VVEHIGVARGVNGAMPPQIFGKYSDFVLREAFSQQDSVIRLIPNILAPPKFLPKNFWAGYVTGRTTQNKGGSMRIEGNGNL